NSRMEIKREKINFKKTIDEILENLSYLDKASEVEVATEIEVENFRSDMSRLKIIFSNMISNAIKYQKPEGKEKSKLFIGIRPGKSNVIITFKDNGEGISK